MNDPLPFHGLAQGIVVRAIEQCDDPAERKERIMIAREHGVITQQEAADWLAILELRAA